MIIKNENQINPIWFGIGVIAVFLIVGLMATPLINVQIKCGEDLYIGKMKPYDFMFGNKITYYTYYDNGAKEGQSLEQSYSPWLDYCEVTVI